MIRSTLSIELAKPLISHAFCLQRCWLVLFPSPLWGGVRGGGSHDGKNLRSPLPHPPPQGSRGSPCSPYRRPASGRGQARDRGAWSQSSSISRSGFRRCKPTCRVPALLAACCMRWRPRIMADRPAAFGFLFALTAAALRSRPGPAVLVATRRALLDFGKPCSHGLAQLGLEVGRLLIVETETDKDALWSLEDALRSEARPAAVAGADRRRPRPYRQPPPEPRGRRAFQRRSSSWAPPSPPAPAPPPRAGASLRLWPPATISAPSSVRAGA